MAFLTRRVITPERMDRLDVPLADLRGSLRFLRWVNHRLGGTAAILRHLHRWSSNWPSHRPIRILDIGTGSADIPVAIMRWAGTRGVSIRITAMDIHPLTLRLAREHLQSSGHDLDLVLADARRPPFGPQSFDYCMASLVLHHFNDLEVMAVLKMMADLSCRGLIWNDLRRSSLAYRFCRLLTLGRSPIVRHDASASVMAGFTRPEVIDMCNRLELSELRFSRHMWHRFTMAGPC